MAGRGRNSLDGAVRSLRRGLKPGGELLRAEWVPRDGCTIEGSVLSSLAPHGCGSTGQRRQS